MDAIMSEDRFAYVFERDKVFITAFDCEMIRLGYDFGGSIGSGYCWGKHMLIYTKTGVKSKTVYARIYLQDTGIVLRLFLNKVDQHRAFIENAPPHIKQAFAGEFGDCRHDRDDGDGSCMFRKTYTIDGRLIEKCNGLTFWFMDPASHPVSDYVALFTEFFPDRKPSKKPQPVER